MLRIAPRALHIPHFLGGGPPNPPPPRTFSPDTAGMSVVHCATGPPLGKKPGSAPDM